MSDDKKETNVTNLEDDHDHVVLTLDETEPIVLEEVELPTSYFAQVKRHMSAKFTRLRPDPLNGTGGG